MVLAEVLPSVTGDVMRNAIAELGGQVSVKFDEGKLSVCFLFSRLANNPGNGWGAITFKEGSGCKGYCFFYDVAAVVGSISGCRLEDAVRFLRLPVDEALALAAGEGFVVSRGDRG